MTIRKKILIIAFILPFVAACTAIILNKKSHIEVTPATDIKGTYEGIKLNQKDSTKRKGIHPLEKHDYDTL